MRTWIDFAAIPTFTFSIGAGPVYVEPRLGAMLGMSLYLWNAEDSLVIYNDRIRRTNVGWNVGGLGGVLIRARRATGFVSHLGGIVEFGYMHRAAYANGRTSDLHVSVVHDQFLLQAGIAISLK
jgi:hypothetical protein